MIRKTFEKLGFLVVIPFIIILSSFFAFFYKLLTILNPESFHGLNFQSHAVDFLYYSLTTITTTGYGDIYPVTKTAKILSSLEIVFGLITIFSAVFYEVAGKRSQKR